MTAAEDERLLLDRTWDIKQMLLLLTGLFHTLVAAAFIFALLAKVEALVATLVILAIATVLALPFLLLAEDADAWFPFASKPKLDARKGCRHALLASECPDCRIDGDQDRKRMDPRPL